ncbi:hypothetical protein D3C75_1000680 [compost metagenome]
MCPRFALMADNSFTSIFSAVTAPACILSAVTEPATIFSAVMLLALILFTSKLPFTMNSKSFAIRATVFARLLT